MKTGGILSRGPCIKLLELKIKVFVCLDWDITCIFLEGVGDIGSKSIMFIRFSRSITQNRLSAKKIHT